MPRSFFLQPNRSYQSFTLRLTSSAGLVGAVAGGGGRIASESSARKSATRSVRGYARPAAFETKAPIVPSGTRPRSASDKQGNSSSISTRRSGSLVTGQQRISRRGSYRSRIDSVLILVVNWHRPPAPAVVPGPMPGREHINSTTRQPASPDYSHPLKQVQPRALPGAVCRGFASVGGLPPGLLPVRAQTA